MDKINEMDKISYDVFISHSMKPDGKIAQKIRSYLESHDLKCWMAPTDILPGERYNLAITRGVNNSSVLLLIISSHSINSNHIISEVCQAFENKIPIIPIKIEDVNLPDELKYYLRTRQFMNAFPQPINKIKEGKLVNTIKGHLTIKTEVDLCNAIKEKMTNNLKIFDAFGYEFKLLREYKMEEHFGRIDLLCEDKKNKNLVIVEIKNHKVDEKTFEQISNLVYTMEKNADESVNGLVICRGYTEEFNELVKKSEKINQLNFSELGFK